MKLHLMEETDTATVAGEVLSGPLTVDCDKATVGAETFARGVVVVRDGEAVRVAEMTPAGQWGLLASLIGGLVLGLVASKQWVLRCVVLSFLFSASLYGQGWKMTAWASPGGYASPSVAREFSLRIVQSGNPGNVLEAAPARGIIVTAPPNQYVGAFPELTRDTGPEPQSMLMSRNVGESTWNFWGVVRGWSSWAPPPEYKRYDLYLPVNNNRDKQSSYAVRWYGVNGEPEKVMEFDLPAYGKRTVHLSELYPFRAVVVRSWFDTTMVDGQPLGAGMEIDVEPEESIETNVETVPTPEELEPSVTEVESSYEKPPSPPDEPRPTGVETLSDLNEADEARHGEAKGQLENVNKQLETGIKQSADAAGQAKSDAKGIQSAVTASGKGVEGAVGGLGTKLDGVKDKLDELKDGDGQGAGAGAGAIEGAEQEAAGSGEGFWGAANGLSNELGAWTGIWNLSISGAQYPKANIMRPAMLGGGNWELDLGEYDTFWQILRAVLLVVVAWHFLTLTIETVRGGVA